MNGVIEKAVDTAPQTKRKLPPVGKAGEALQQPPVTQQNPMLEIDQLIQPIASQIEALLRPIADAWPWGGDFPGKPEVLAADNVLTDLSMGPDYWAAESRPRPITGSMLEDLRRHLNDALDQIEAANDFDPGQRRLLLLLVREAVAQDQALGRAFGEACLGKRYEPLRALALGAGGKLMTCDTFEVNPSTPLLEAGKSAADMAIWCTHDIETLSNEVILLGDDCDYEGQTSIGAKLRCFGARINSLNSVVMSYLGGDDNLTIGEVNTAYYGGAKPFKPQETTHA